MARLLAFTLIYIIAVIALHQRALANPQGAYMTPEFLDQLTAYLVIAGTLLSMVYVIGSSPKLKRFTGWRTFFLVHHTALIMLAFAALWLSMDYLKTIALVWGVTMPILTVWHWKLVSAYG